MIYCEIASGKSMAGGDELAAAINDLDRGDEIVIAERDHRCFKRNNGGLRRTSLVLKWRARRDSNS